MIEFKGLSKTYQMGEVEVHALKNVDMHIAPHEFVAIVGPSGSGKSTMMNIIGCLDIPTSGTYILDGEDVSECTENQLSEIRSNKIGFIFQQFNLLPTLSAYENVEMPLLYHKMSKAERKKRVTELLAQVGLADRMWHKPTQLSGGQQQRVAIARALATYPNVILADEPTGNLDQNSGKEVMEILTKLWKEGKTIVLITHDKHVAAQAHRQIYVLDGEISTEEAIV